MKTNSLFFIFFAAIFFTQTSYIYGMLARQAQIASPHKFSKYTSQMRMYTTQNFHIVPYNPEEHEKYINPIVFQNAHRIMSDITDENRYNETEKIISTMSKMADMKPFKRITSMKASVCLDNDTHEPIGIVNYLFREQSYKPITDMFNIDVPQNAIIQMLAVDEKHQGKKIGSALLQHALKDCEQQGVYKVTLGTTTSALEKFYEKQHGFTCTWDGSAIRSPNSEFTKWFQPQHPVVAAILIAWQNSQHKK